MQLHPGAAGGRSAFTARWLVLTMARVVRKVSMLDRNLVKKMVKDRAGGGDEGKGGPRRGGAAGRWR